MFAVTPRKICGSVPRNEVSTSEIAVEKIPGIGHNLLSREFNNHGESNEVMNEMGCMRSSTSCHLLL